MIVIGVDAHKRTHTLIVLDGVTGVDRGQLTVPSDEDGMLMALRFAAGVDQDRVWAVEDCRHVTSRLERALLGAGERVIRVPPALTGESRKATRTACKSDAIDARAVALAAIREGVETLPVALLDEQAYEIRVLCDYRDQLMRERAKLINRMRWHLVKIAPETLPIQCRYRSLGRWLPLRLESAPARQAGVDQLMGVLSRTIRRLLVRAWSRSNAPSRSVSAGSVDQRLPTRRTSPAAWSC